jgi:undecaprenyl pyrophosphate synthase
MQRNIHVGIIPDGNRRWCKKNEKSFQDYAEMIRVMLFAAYENNKDELHIPFETFTMISEISFYVLSKDNLTKRDDGTLKFIEMAMDIVCSLMQLDSVNSRVKMDFVGDVQALPITIQYQIARCVRMSKGTFPVHLALAYDPVSDSAAYLAAGMQSRTQIDLMIRSGGELRSSGFFPLQTLYSEWVYFNDLWPEMSLGKMHEALLEFKKRNRNFGK